MIRHLCNLKYIAGFTHQKKRQREPPNLGPPNLTPLQISVIVILTFKTQERLEVYNQP